MEKVKGINRGSTGRKTDKREEERSGIQKLVGQKLHKGKKESKENVKAIEGR